jgi:uncharacterized protein
MRLQLQGETLDLDPSGAVFLPRWAMLVVADLHLEKGGAFARRGSLLPPYDSHATLERLEGLVDRLRPNIVVSLGDASTSGTAAASSPPTSTTASAP